MGTPGATEEACGNMERREVEEVEPREWKNERRVGIWAGMNNHGS